MHEVINRRQFISTAARSSAAFGLAPVLVRAAEALGGEGTLPRRTYRPGVELSIIGFPGLMLRRLSQADSNRVIAQAFERGCIYFDVAPAYGDAQQKMGPALEPYRKRAFLSCKTQARDAERCRKELDESLRLLRTDHFDLYQLHVLKDVEKDVDAAFRRGGAMETILDARKAGVIRYIGFSAHTIEAGVAALERFNFDSAMFPINFASFTKGQFGPRLLELAKSKNAARISIKSLVRQEWPQNASRGRWSHLWYEPLSDPAEADLGLRWALSQDITCAIPPSDEEMFWLGVSIACRFKPITAEEQKRVETLAESLNPLFRKGKIT